MSAYLNIDHVGMTFPTDAGPLNVLDDVNLRVNKGEFITLIGHSGCGKSTVLNIVAGLLNASRGGVILEGREVSDPGPDRAVVFQNHSLLPWLSVYSNVRLAVDQVFKKTMSKRERDAWTRSNLELVQMSHALDLRPDEISGGMKQRVGIARALAMQPRVLLMDEPFGALDALTRTHMQDSLMEIHAGLNNTVLMITHDVDEAVLLSDRIVMMSNGPSATIGDVLEVDLPHPRDRLELADNPDYNHYRAEVVRFLHERHKGASPEVSDTDAQLADTRPQQSGLKPEKHEVMLGFVPLTDCAPLVIAREMGLFKKHGLSVQLSKESSWASIRDKVGYGVLDGAQMLAAMPLTASVQQQCQPMVTALSLSLNGNAITVSNALYELLEAVDDQGLDTAEGSARALAQVVRQRQNRGEAPLQFGVVYPESTHNYLLRYWMASAGIDPDKDVEIRVVPPPYMVDRLRAGSLSGYCVGEPWNAQAINDGIGQVLTTTHAIWNHHPEKVFGVTRAWAEAYPGTHQAILMALLEACSWLDVQENRNEACRILSRPEYVDSPVEVLAMSLQESAATGAQPTLKAPVFHRYLANQPWRSHAAWFLSQMLRWGQITQPQALAEIVESVYRPDLYREAAVRLGMPVSQLDMRCEGEHGGNWWLEGENPPVEMGADSFMDGRRFDPHRVIDYINGFTLSHEVVELAAWRPLNPVREKADGTCHEPTQPGGAAEGSPAGHSRARGNPDTAAVAGSPPARG